MVLPDGSLNYIELPDPALNIVLAAISLVFEVMGNVLLIMRFSNFHTRITTWLSFACWNLKIVFGLANYIQFGLTYPEVNGIVYLQGFWVSLSSISDLTK